jgi:hypothetical protein
MAWNKAKVGHAYIRIHFVVCETGCDDSVPLVFNLSECDVSLVGTNHLNIALLALQQRQLSLQESRFEASIC